MTRVTLEQVWQAVEAALAERSPAACS